MQAALLKTLFIFVFNDRGSSDSLQVEIQRKFCGFRAPSPPNSPPRCPTLLEFGLIPESFLWPEGSLEVFPMRARE